MFRRTLIAVALLVFALFASIIAQAQLPAFGHIVIVVEENEDYSTVVGSSNMPYLNGLANQYGLATNYYGNAHYSIGNYFMLTTGELITDDDGFTCPVTIDNIVRDIMNAGTGKTWKAYAESIPSAGYTGGDSYPYVKHHDPFAYFKEVLNNSTEKANLVPFTQFLTDLNNNALPNYAFIIPNLQSDMHDCPPGMTSCTNAQKLSYGDQWLQTNIGPLLTNPQFQQDGLLIITFDESSLDDSSHGGGRVATVIVSPKSKPGYHSSTLYQHQAILRTAEEALGLGVFPGLSDYTPDFSEFFVTGTEGAIAGTVTNASTGNPIAGATVSGPGQTSTTSTGTYTLSNVSPGTYTVTASANGYQSSSSSVSVTSGATATQNFALTPQVTGSLSGSVISAVNGAGISGVTVSYSAGSTLTDSTGHYTLSSIVPGTYSFTATKSGWGKSTQSATITAGVTSTLNFKLSTSGVIKGTVTNSSGAAISGASVNFTGGDIATNKTVTTSSTGSYSSGWIPIGTYTVTATSGSSSKSQTVSITSGQTLTLNITLP